MMSALKLPVTLLHDQADACLAQWVAQLAQWPAPWPSAVALDASALADFVLLDMVASVCTGRTGIPEAISVAERQAKRIYR